MLRGSKRYLAVSGYRAYTSNQTQRIFAIVMPLVALSPALAPILGAYMIQDHSWHYIFFVPGGLGCCLWLVTLQLSSIKPTLSQSLQPLSLKDMIKAPLYQ